MREAEGGREGGRVLKEVRKRGERILHRVHYVTLKRGDWGSYIVGVLQ